MNDCPCFVKENKYSCNVFSFFSCRFFGCQENCLIYKSFKDTDKYKKDLKAMTSVANTRFEQIINEMKKNTDFEKRIQELTEYINYLEGKLSKYEE